MLVASAKTLVLDGDFNIKAFSQLIVQQVPIYAIIVCINISFVFFIHTC